MVLKRVRIDGARTTVGFPAERNKPNLCCVVPAERNTMSTPLKVMLAAGALVLAACGGGTTPGEPTTSEQHTTTSGGNEVSDQPAVGELPEGPSALDSMFAEEFPEPLIDPGQVLSGGPPPDGIPSIDDPAFLDVSDNLSRWSLSRSTAMPAHIRFVRWSGMRS